MCLHAQEVLGFKYSLAHLGRQEIMALFTERSCDSGVWSCIRSFPCIYKYPCRLHHAYPSDSVETLTFCALSVNDLTAHHPTQPNTGFSDSKHTQHLLSRIYLIYFIG
jgi:hypothetical protein